MSVTRDILIDSSGPIERLASDLNAALTPDVPLTIKTVDSPSGSWLIAEGYAKPYPLVLMDTTWYEDETGRAGGLGWLLELHCRLRPGEEHASFEARCDADALTAMRRIAAALRARCVALSNLQTFLGEAP